MTDRAWDELIETTVTIEFIQKEIARCHGSSAHRRQLEANLGVAEEKRAYLFRKLCDAVPDDVIA